MAPMILLASVTLMAGSVDAKDASRQPSGRAANLQPAPSDGEAKASVLAEYRTRRATMPDTAYAHHELRLWCARNGLGCEALTQLRLQVQAEKREIREQRKWVQQWEPRLRKWRSWLAIKASRPEAESILAEVSDPQAVPAIWKVFASGSASDRKRAVQLLGQIRCAAASRSLALLAVSDESAEVRRTATETLRWRDPMEFAGLLVGLLRDPVAYEVHPVGAPVCRAR
jgi:hypothetical protein